MLGVKKSMNRLIHMQKTNKSIFTASSRYIPAIISSSSSLPSYIFQQRNSLHIAIEETPNPKSMKFLPKNRAVIEPEDGGEDDTCWSFRDAVHNVEDVREGAPLAADILALDNVNEVMLTPNSITVNVNHVSEWVEIEPLIVEIVQEAYDAQLYNPFSIIENAELAKEVGTTGSNITWEPDSIEAEIEEHLDANIRPFVKEDGGDIYLVSVEPDNNNNEKEEEEEESLIVKVQMIGACSGCPSSAVTLHGRVETMLKHYFPEISSVIQVEDEAILAKLDAKPKTTLEEHIRILTQQGEDSSIVWGNNDDDDSNFIINSSDEEDSITTVTNGTNNHVSSSPRSINDNGKRRFSTTFTTIQKRNMSSSPNNARFSILFPSPLWHANLLTSTKSHRGKGRGMGSSGILDERINMKVKEKILNLFQSKKFQNMENSGIVNQYSAAGYDARMAKNNEFFQYQIDTICAEQLEIAENKDDDPIFSEDDDTLLWSKEYSSSKEMKELVKKFRDSCIWFLQDSFGVDTNQAKSFVYGKQLVVWASVHGSGSGHPYHIHSDGVLSGVYYANLPPGSGSIKFCDPRGVSPFQPLHQEEAMPPFHQEHSMRPAVGDLIVFPSWLPHAVDPCKESSSFAKAANYRISVSFNLLGKWDELPGCSINLRSEKIRKVSGAVDKDETFARFITRKDQIAAAATRVHDDEDEALSPSSTSYDDVVEIVDDAQDFAALLAAKFGKDEVSYGKRPDGMPERKGGKS